MAEYISRHASGTVVDDLLDKAQAAYVEKHTHDNADTLSKIGETDGQPTFGGLSIKGEQGPQGIQGESGRDGKDAQINGINTLEIIDSPTVTTELNAEAGTLKLHASVSGLISQIIVTTQIGAVVTCTNGEQEFELESADGQVVFHVSSYGDWTLTATLENRTSGSITVTVDTVKQYFVTVNVAEVSGVEWDYANPSTALVRLTRANDPNGIANTDITTEPVPVVGTNPGSSPFDNLMPWSDMDEFNVINNAVSYRRGEAGFSRTSYDTVIRIPKFWYKVEKDTANSKMRFYVADKAVTGFSVHPAFARGDGRERDCIYVGKYNTGAGYVTKSGLTPLQNITRTAARTGSAGKGAPWWQYDYIAWSAIWLLYLVEFADWNSQKKIGRGNVDNSTASIFNTGGCDTLTYHTGRASGTDGKTPVQYRWLENLWGNVSDWCDGFNAGERVTYLCLNPENFADNTAINYMATGITLPPSDTSRLIKELGFSDTFPFAFIPIAGGGSETTYISDSFASATGWCALSLSNAWNGAGNGGMFHFGAHVAASYSAGGTGTRLMFLPNEDYQESE